MLTRIMKSLLVGGDVSAMVWWATTMGTASIRGIRFHKGLLVFERDKKEVQYSVEQILNLFENGSNEETVPLLYHINRFYDTGNETDVLLTKYARECLNDKVEFSLPVAFFCYNDRVLTAVTDQDVPKKIKYNTKAIMVEKVEDAHRLILLSNARMFGCLFERIREREDVKN